jgi:hypothetical protein
MSTFDAVRNRKRGEEAKDRVLSRTYSPKEEHQESTFSAVRNRKSADTATTDSDEADRARMILGDTLAGVGIGSQPQGFDTTPAPQKTVDFKAEQAKKNSSPFQDKLPAASLIQTGQGVQSTLKDKVPAANLVQQTGRGPANASNIPGVSQYEITKKEIADDNAPDAVKAYANIMNYITQGNPAGGAVSRAFAGNSGATRRDTTKFPVIDKVTDAINNFVTPFVTPTGAPVGQGIIGSTYGATEKALSGKTGQSILNAASKVIPGSQDVVRVAATEALAGGLQGAGFGLQQGQDSGNEIARNALLGTAAGGVLGGIGAAASEGLTSALSKIMKRSGRADDEVAATLEEVFTPRQAEGVPQSEIRNNLPETNPLALPQSPELLALPPGRSTATTARIEQRTNVYRQKFENLIAEAQKRPLTPGREDLELENLWSQMADRTDPSLNELIDLAYPKRTAVPQKGMVGAARANQEMREVAGVGNPVKSSAPQVFNDAAAPTQVLGRKGTTGTASEGRLRTNTLTREQEIMNKVNAKQPLTQSDIEFAQSAEFDKNKLFPESTPEKSTYVKARPAQPEVKPPYKPEPVMKSTPKSEVQEVEEAIKAVNQPNVRDKVYSYLDEAEKAARERIAKRKGYLNSSPLPEWADYAVIMAAKLGKGTIKTANFTEELVKEFGEKVRPHAEKILRMSREELRKQERLATKEGKSAAEFNAKPEGDAASFAEKISRNAPKKSTPFAERWQKWRTQTTDDLAALETVEKNVRGGKLASAEDSLYKAARMFKGAPERASQIVQDRLGSVIKKVEKAGNSVEDLEKYALAMHAKDVNAAGYKSGFTDQEIKSILDQFNTPEMNAAQKELVKVNRDMLKELVDSGVVSKELYDVLEDRWKNYIPLFREMDNEKVGFGGGLSSALANVTSPIKALQGSEKKVIAPLQNMVKNIFQSVNAAERNKVAQQIPKLAELDENGTFFRKITNAEQVGEKNVVKVKVDGKEVRYEVQPEVYKAIMNLDQESSNTLMNILSKPASLLRAGATLTPEFALRNPIRDINNAFVVSESGFNPITDFGAGLIQTIKKGPLYKDWIDNLGAYGNTLSLDRDVHKKALETVLKQPNSKKFVNIVNGKSIIGLLRAISDTTESATKVGEYRAALRSGASKQEAAYRSRDLMDFARAGSSIRPTNKIVAFMNANIQGKSKLIRAIKNDWVGVTTRGVVSVSVPTIGIFILNHKYANETQKSTISNAPDWMKDSFWLMAIPGTDTVARIPKPFDLATIFANLPEKALSYTLEKDPEAFDGYVRRSIKSNSLPTQISGILPVIEGMANYSFFKEGTIIPRAEQLLQYKDQYDPVRTTSTARIIAGGVEKLTDGKGSFKNFSSPRVIDNTLQGLTAGLGKYATDAIDVILDKTGAYERTTKPAKSIEQAPFTRSFLVDPNQGGKAMDKFYMKKDELTKEKASAKLNKKPFKKQGELERINNVSDAVSDINKTIKAIERGELSAKQKQLKIEPLIKRRNDLVQRITQSLKDKK